jgi:hypothetical protein
MQVVLKAAGHQIHSNFYKKIENTSILKSKIVLKVIYTLQTTLTIHANVKIDVKICQKSPCCFSHTVEIL